jgi:uncharacterized protein DUF4145
MLKSWWDLGEWSGHHGGELALHQIACPFCLERGNFAIEHKASKKKPNGSKILHFDTLKCGSCAGYVMALWSRSELGGGMQGMHDFRVLPWPIRLEKSPKHWPEAVGRFWLQAHRSRSDANWDAAAVMARSALQVALRDHDAEGGSLKAEIDNLAGRGVLPPHMQEWAHELRELDNESAHPDVTKDKSSAADVRDVIEFLDFLLQYLYDLPREIQQYRERRAGKSRGTV